MWVVSDGVACYRIDRIQWHRLYDLPLSDDKNDMELFSGMYSGYFFMNSGSGIASVAQVSRR